MKKYILLWLIFIILEVSLYFLLKDANISPTIFSIGSFEIRWYGLMYIVAIFLALWFLKRDFQRFNVNVPWKQFEDAAFWIIVFAIIGARLYHVFGNWDYYGRFPSEIVAIWHGGLAIYGGILGGLISGYIIARIKRWDFWKLADIIIVYLPLGQAIGRWGNFFNKEAYGPPSDLPWAIYIPPENRLEIYKDYDYFHPTFMYESILNLTNFFILLYVRNETLALQRRGFMVGLYLINYGIIRFVLEFLRPDTDTFMGVKIAHIFSILSIIVGLLLVWRSGR